MKACGVPLALIFALLLASPYGWATSPPTCPDPGACFASQQAKNAWASAEGCVFEEPEERWWNWVQQAYSQTEEWVNEQILSSKDWIKDQLGWGPGEGAPITEQQRALLDAGDYMAFWRSRWTESKDPVARTALIGWGQPEVVNATRFEIYSAQYTWWRLNEYILENELDVTTERMALEVALAHADAVDDDYQNIPHLLSPRQTADYHHLVFGRHGIPPGIFGGTHSSPPWDPEGPLVPANLYDFIWCMRCDSDVIQDD